MARRVEINGVDAAMEQIMENGLEGLGEAVRTLINEAMRIERARHLGAESWERSEGRQGYANGYKPKTLKTRLGEVRVAVPQVRDGSFYPAALERGQRSERALKLALAEMYIQRVSTRKVAKITETLCGFEVSSTEVSRCTALLDEVRTDGKRDILGVSVALSEAEVHWRQFLTSLKDRSLHGIKLLVADDHAGLKAARCAVFPSVPWQRCQFHLQQNAGHYVPRVEMRVSVASDIRAIFSAPDDVEARRLLEHFVKRYAKTAPKLAQWAETALPEGIVIMNLPEQYRRRLRTTNVLERLNKEIKRRTWVATLFPNEAACLRLVGAVAMEISEEWLTGRSYLSIKE